MKKLDSEQLLAGDIILTTANHWKSKAIRSFTKSDISHAMVYVQPFSLIDSTGEGVHARSSQRLFWPDTCAVHVLRLNRGLADDKADAIVTYARQQVGTRYSTVGAIRSAIGRGSPGSPRQFCSRLVARAFAAANIMLVDSPDYCTPEEVKNSPLLSLVPNAVVAAEQSELDAQAQEPGPLQAMIDVTNVVLDGARQRNPDIENLNDIDAHLIDKPSDDPYFAKLFEESGYLGLWQQLRISHPEHYDLKVLQQFPAPDQDKMEHSETIIRDYESNVARFLVNLRGYEHLVDAYQLKTFRQQRDLQQSMLNLHRTRYEVASAWLSQNVQGWTSPLDSLSRLVPHSDEWFAAVDASNPIQAAQVRHAIAAMERKDVCSVCGDDPARDYRMLQSDEPIGAVLTIRLCDDCLKIRTTSLRKTFVPM